MNVEGASRRARGRPRATEAIAHAAILDTVHRLLQQYSVRDLTIETIAREAGVSKPTIYKWWPTKTDLVLTMFQERLDAGGPRPALEPSSGKDAMKTVVRMLIDRFNGLFGKVLTDLIAEGQHDPVVLATLYGRHMQGRRDAAVAQIIRARSAGELPDEADPDLVVDAIFAPLYYRLLVLHAPLTHEYGDALVEQAFRCRQHTPADPPP